MKKQRYSTVLQAEVKADCYGGETCDQITTHFESYAAGDRDSDTHTDDIVLKLSDLPAGAKITVAYPDCPDCGEIREDLFDEKKNIIGHAEKCRCGFDWKEWVINEYS